MRFSKPNEAGSVFRSDLLPLPVSEEIDDDAPCACEKNGAGPKSAEMVGMIDQIESGRGIDAREPNKASPADHEACPIVHNV